MTRQQEMTQSCLAMEPTWLAAVLPPRRPTRGRHPQPAAAEPAQDLLLPLPLPPAWLHPVHVTLLYQSSGNLSSLESDEASSGRQLRPAESSAVHT